MRRTDGFSLIEVLIALAVFTVVAALAGSGIVQALRLQALNETSTSLQAKLRRVTEVVAQDLRSTMFGGLTDTPVASGATGLSFTLADRGQGYEVLPSGGNSFPNSANVDIFAVAPNAAALGLEDTEAMMVNQTGDAIVFTITNVTGVGPVARQQWNVVHAGCNNTIAYVPPVRLFSVASVGYRFDADAGELLRQVGAAAERVLAFGLSDVAFAYAYEAEDGTTVVRATPFDDGTGPLRIADVGGVIYVLSGIQVTVTAEEGAGGRTVERSYVAHVRMPDAGTVKLRSVVSCP
ncbi:MAG: prepilin-type N-terminal cleavage/methylation domain-containing protein [Trueperaceae bacterium]|nr:prepilin-type N-terminal cleavage/methylation domain-containing protein [Trueperaceae bacterium]